MLDKRKVSFKYNYKGSFIILDSTDMASCFSSSNKMLVQGGDTDSKDATTVKGGTGAGRPSEEEAAATTYTSTCTAVERVATAGRAMDNSTGPGLTGGITMETEGCMVDGGMVETLDREGHLQVSKSYYFYQFLTLLF